MDGVGHPEAGAHRGRSGHRTMVFWCPDWPVLAAVRQQGGSANEPAAVFHANRVQACNRAARAEGVRVGLRRRDAQSRCPELLVLHRDQDRDARHFEPIAAAIEELAPAVEILRPGLLAVAARGPARYFGSEPAAVEAIVDAVEAMDVECQAGIADNLPVAVLAARRSTIVPVDAAPAFCARLPIVELAREPAIAPPERAQLVDLLIRLGISTAGDFAALPEIDVATRFGADGLVAHLLARGVAERGLSRRQIPDELVVEKVCDPPLERVDTAAFLGRELAGQFHSRLADAGMACTRLAISAETETGDRLSRIWRCARPLTAAATADRLRWQLDGWLTAGRADWASRSSAAATRGTGPRGGDPTDEPGADGWGGPGGIVRLRLEPVEAIGAGLIQYGLWGSDGAEDQRAGWACARVQGLLGPAAVLVPVRSGGRGPADRITLVPWGEETKPERDPDAPWPGAIPAPSPSMLAAPGAGRPVVDVLDDLGRPVIVHDRGLLGADPAWMVLGADRHPVTGWAGPWMLDERWWAADSAPSALVFTAPVSTAPVSTAPVFTAPGPPAPQLHASATPSGGSYLYQPRPGDLDYVKPPRAVQGQDLTTLDSVLARPPRYSARMQLATADLVLLLTFGPHGWEVEGEYD